MPDGGHRLTDIDRSNGVAIGEQRNTEVGSHVAGRAGDDNEHLRPRSSPCYRGRISPQQTGRLGIGHVHSNVLKDAFARLSANPASP